MPYSICPACQEEVDLEEFCKDFPCPKCAAVLKALHDCYYDESTGDETCSNWLEKAL